MAYYTNRYLAGLTNSMRGGIKFCPPDLIDLLRVD
jgi:hypothetical protein